MQWEGAGLGEWKMEIVADKITELSAKGAAPEAVAALQPQHPHTSTSLLSSLRMLQRQNYACMSVCVCVCGVQHVGWAEAPQGLNLKCQKHQRDLDNAVAAAATPRCHSSVCLSLCLHSWPTTNCWEFHPLQPTAPPDAPNRLRVSQTKQWLALTIDMWCQSIFTYMQGCVRRHRIP